MAIEMAIPLFPQAHGQSTHNSYEPIAAQGAAAQTARPALRVQHLSKYFGDQLILANVSFTVAEGESLVLLGPSGSGKSTTLRLIAGLEQMDTGEIFLKGRHIGHLRARERQIGVIFQQYALFPRMTVADNIGFGLKIRGVRKAARLAKVEELLALIGLAEHRDKYPLHLSGGQQQRVAIARALAYQPDLLLFDESFSALDPHTRTTLRREIRALLRRLQIPAIFITHDQEEAMELGDQIAILNGGRIEQIGTPYEIYNDPHTEFVATFLGAANVLEGYWRGNLIELDADHHLVGNGLVEAAHNELVKVVFRPEDIVLGLPLEPLDTPHPLGLAQVEEVTFTGAAEILQVRLLPKSTGGLTLAAADGLSRNTSSAAPLKVTRTRWEAEQLRLRSFDQVALGLRQYKMLRQHA